MDLAVNDIDSRSMYCVFQQEPVTWRTIVIVRTDDVEIK
jgi:hypothetical protein